MGWTVAPTWQKPARQFKKIDWTCDCGMHNINLGRFSGTVGCWKCGRSYDIEISAIPSIPIEAGEFATRA